MVRSRGVIGGGGRGVGGGGVANRDGRGAQGGGEQKGADKGLTRAMMKYKLLKCATMATQYLHCCLNQL